MREQNYWLRRSRFTRRRLVQGAALGAGGLASIALVGCGDDDDSGGGGATDTPASGETPTNGATPTTSAGGLEYPAPPAYSDLDPQQLLADFHWSKVAPQSQVLGTPRMGGVLVLPTASFGLQSLHPTEESVGQWPFCYTHNNLLGQDFRHETLGLNTLPPTVDNSVSQDWEQPDEVTYNFTLRDGVTWHNVAPANGEPLTIDDIRETYDLFKTSTFHGHRFKDIQSIEEPEPGMVQVKMAQPNAAMIHTLRIPSFAILNAKHIDEGSLGDKAIGTGPFMQGRFEPNQVRIYEKNPTYWLKDALGNQLPYLDGAVHSIIPDPSAAVAAFRAGEIDDYKPTSAEEFNRLRDELDVWAQVGIGYCGCSSAAVAFSYRDSTFSDPRVRRALSMAIDRQDMIDTIFGGAATNRSFIPSWWLGLPWPKTIEEMGANNAYDPEGAKALLSQAGAEDLSFDLHFTGQVSPGTGQSSGDVYVENLKRDFADIGVQVNLKPYDVLGGIRTFYGQEWSGMFRRNAGSGVVMSSEDFLDFVRAGSGLNGGGVNDSDLEGMLADLRRTFDTEKQEALNKDLDKYIAEDNIVYGPSLPDAFAYTTWYKYLHNVVDSPSWWINGGGGQMLTHAWLDENAPQRDLSQY